MAKVTNSGLSFCSLLTILFVGLKLCDKINWSWWWVLSPIWAPWALVAVVGAVLMLVAVIRKVSKKAIGKEA